MAGVPVGDPKPCIGCGKGGPEVTFWGAGKGLRTRRCSDCLKEQRDPNYHASWRKDNADRLRSYNQQYYQDHCEEKKSYNRGWKASHPEQHRSGSRRWYRANSDRAKTNVRKWQRNNGVRKRLYSHKRRALSNGSWTPAEWEALKAFYDFACLACGRKEPDIELTFDHVIPLSKGGPNTIDNCQPLCRSCNSSKQARDTDYRESFPRRVA